MENTKYAVWASALSGILLAAMLSISMLAGVTQQAFEFVQPPGQYAAELIRFAAPLRIILSFDNLFIAAYVLGTFFFCRMLKERQSDATLLNITVALVAAGGLLDLAENLHILAMLSGALQNIALSAGQIELQSVLSALKWHLAYTAFVIIGIAFKPKNLPEKLFVASLIVVQMPVGIFVYTAPSDELSRFFQILRYGNLLAGFAVIVWLSLRMGKNRAKDR
jgi:hypothetical protein